MDNTNSTNGTVETHQMVGNHHTAVENQETNNDNVPQKHRHWLNNYVGKRKLGKVEYEDHDQIVRPSNSHIWTSTAWLNGISYGVGESDTKGGAREAAAEEALAELKRAAREAAEEGAH